MAKKYGMISVGRQLAVAASVSIAVALGACSFDFDRLAGIEPGDVTGRTVDARNGTKISFSRVGFDDSTRITVAKQDGTFKFAGLAVGQYLLRLVDDDDGDGAADRAALRAFAMINTTSPEGEQVTSSVLLGDVRMEGTADIVGRAVDEAGAPVAGARVVVFRRVKDLSPDQLGPAANKLELSLGVEAETTTDATGAFLVEGVVKGVVRVFISTDAPIALASPETLVTARSEQETDAGDVVLFAATTRAVQVEILNPPASGDVAVDVVTRGGDPNNVADVLVSQRVEANGTVGGLDVPTTNVDVYVRAFGGQQQQQVTAAGVLLARAVPPGDDVLVWGSVVLVDGDPCGAPEDRDGDGVARLPDPSLDLQPWIACAPACADEFGTGNGASCNVQGPQGERAFDCDDDRDGQPDVTEPYHCVSLCSGTDLDGDGLCGGADDFPQCAENDASAPACAAGAHPFDPPPPVFGEGEGEGEGELPDYPLDLGPTEAWSVGVGDINAPCEPLNPREDAFSATVLETTFAAASSDAGCCTCVERVRTFDFSPPLQGATFLKGALTSTFNGQFSQSDVRIVVNTADVGTLHDVEIKTEERPNNNCLSSGRPDIVTDAGGVFSLDVTDHHVSSVIVHLQGYACGDADNQLTLSNLGFELAAVGPCTGTDIACDSNPVVTCAAELDALSACTHLTDLTILAGADITSLAPLAGLETIDNGFIITGQSITSLVSLPTVTVGSSLQIVGTGITSLAGIGNVSTTSLGLSSNVVLTSLDGIQPLLDAGLDTLSIGGNALPELAAIGGTPRFFDSITITNEPALRSLAGMEDVFAIQSALYIAACPLLTDVSALEAVSQMGSLYLSNLPIAALPPFLAQTGAGSIILDSLPNLTSFPKPRWSTALAVYNLPLTNGAWLSRPTVQGGQVSIDNCPTLTSLAGRDTFQAGDLTGLSVTNNPQLNHCDAETLAGEAGVSFPTITGNDDTGTCG